jgi:type II restriction/modification system DNA methylase subunit YeeA
MTAQITPQEFVDKWRRSSLKERSASQEHFIDLCRILGHPTPAKADPEGATFTFEKGAGKRTGGQGWADVWKKGCFAWEYKGKHRDLDAAYEQLQLYRDALLNPPLLIVSDMETIVVHTNFTNTIKQTFPLALDDLLTREGLATLRNAFEHPERLRAEQTPEGVTKQAAAEFGRLAESLRNAGHDPEKAAHFLIRILFCLFAEDIGLLPEGLFTKLIDGTKDDPARFRELLEQLFGHMAQGGFFGLERIPHFDGGIFDTADALPLDRDGLDVLSRVARLDWSNIEPSILGTLFERGLDPGKRAQLGAHYTSRDDILLIVEPVLMRPLRRRWDEVKAQARELRAKWQAADSAGGAKTRARRRLEKLLHGFADEIADTQVLDPACGSGNFLYVALKQMLDLEKDVILFATELGLPMFFPTVAPEQLFGIEINEYAHELAQATIWIGYIQWLRENGFGQPKEPILKKLDNIHEMDAILAFDEDGNPTEPEWPEADVAIGNPPFLGGKLLRSWIGDDQVDRMFALWDGRVARESDLCCYWFEKARAMIESGRLKRSGLLATQGIRGGANRKTLERIKESGDIFWAQSDREWILEGAAVHVSMVGFDSGAETERKLDGRAVQTINPDLTTALNLTQAGRLPENRGIAFMGDTKGGSFDIPDDLARQMLAAAGNPNGRPNSDVIRPWVNARDITSRSRGMWIIDFGTEMPEEEAAQYEQPFAHVLREVKPKRDANKRASYREKYWIHVEPRPAMRAALGTLARYIATTTVSKHRLFAWLAKAVLPDHQLIVFAREDDYFFGVLHSKVHELWARRQGTQLREVESGFRYTPTTCFETFPFPWPPRKEPADDPRVRAIAEAAKDLVEKRDRWLNPEGASEPELKKRTLTNLYNQRPTWLDLAHEQLDDTVLDAYAWPRDLTDDQILERLLALNLDRARSS